MKRQPKPRQTREDQQERRGRGRPPVAPENLRTETILVRFTPEERRAADAAATDKGLTLGVWLRNLALKAIGYKPKPPAGS